MNLIREMPRYYESTKRWIFVTHNFARFSSQNSPDRLVTVKLIRAKVILPIKRAREFDWWWMLAFRHRLKLTGFD